MNIEAVQESQEIRFKAAILEQQMLKAARMVPELTGIYWNRFLLEFRLEICWNGFHRFQFRFGIYWE
jgi:hypothetical protein